MTTALPRTGKAVLGYVVLVGVPGVLAVALLLYQGARAVQPGAVAALGAEPGVLGRMLLALPVILLVCRTVALGFRRLGQPAVIGEIFAGVLLGPSFLGLALPQVQEWLFPQQLWTPINLLAQLGLIFFMLGVGAEMNQGAVRSNRAAVLVVSHAGIAIPFLCGVLLAFALYPRFGPQGIGLVPFALFVGVSLSITAFPVLARIVTERRLEGTRLGAISLASAALGDVTAWLLLALVVVTARNTSVGGLAVTLLVSTVFGLVMVGVVRPLAAKVLAAGRLPDVALLPLLLAGVMISALATEAIGIHAIFGAFLFGAVLPRGEARLDQAIGRINAVTGALLLPLFFVYTGLRTDFAAIGTGWAPWLWCATVLGVAVVAKWASATAAARVTGLGKHESLALGALMNCRGLTELIVLNIGLDLGVITPGLFTMFSIMAMVSTVMTSPALTLIDRFTPQEHRFLVTTGGRT